MKKIILISVMVILVITLLTMPVRGESKSSVTETHVVIIAQDADTEVELTVDGVNRGAMYLQSGVNYFAFKTDEKPDVRILAYGDETELKVVEGSGRDWYTFARVNPPVDGDGGVK